MPKKKEKTLEQKEAEVLDGYESWLKKQPVKKVRAQPGDTDKEPA
jgi:hypothetical protein